MTAFTIRVPDELNEELLEFAHQENRSKAYLIRKAIISYLTELKEDRIDAEIALERIKAPNRKFYTTEEARQILAQTNN
jgi:RHH-type rel operon transcriptional repressor/antitoxin RelB